MNLLRLLFPYNEAIVLDRLDHSSAKPFFSRIDSLLIKEMTIKKTTVVNAENIVTFHTIGVEV